MQTSISASARLAWEYNQDLPNDVKRSIEQTDEVIRRRHNGVRRVLLIGGSGYIGAVVTHELLRVGYHVRNLDCNLYENHSVPLGFLAHPNYEFVRGDLADAATLALALAEVSDAVLLGGLVGDPITKKYPQASAAINETGVQESISHMSGRGLNKFIFVSTCSNYGLVKGHQLADENFDLSPLSAYAKAKVAAEKFIFSGRDIFDFNPTVLRFATAFGLSQRMRFDLTVNEFARDLALGKELLVYDAHTWRPYCHVKDFARLIRRVLELPAEQTAFDVFNAGGDVNNHTKQGIIDIIASHVPGIKVQYQENGPDPRNYRVSFKKVKEKILFTPKYTVEDGVLETISAIRKDLFPDVNSRRNYYGNYSISYKGLT